MSIKQFRIRLFSFLSWAKRFFRENPGALFVLSFQVVLVACAVLLAVGLAALAEGLAVVAYFLLVGGVVVQLAFFVKNSRGGRVSE
jgi:hypothetical protein